MKGGRVVKREIEIREGGGKRDGAKGGGVGEKDRDKGGRVKREIEMRGRKE